MKQDQMLFENKANKAETYYCLHCHVVIRSRMASVNLRLGLNLYFVETIAFVLLRNYIA